MPKPEEYITNAIIKNIKPESLQERMNAITNKRMTRWDYLNSFFCARCQEFIAQDSIKRIDTMGRKLCECGTQLRVKPRRKDSKELYRLLETTK